MEHRLTPIIVSGLLVLMFVSGAYVASIMSRKPVAAPCPCDPAITSSAEERILTGPFPRVREAPCLGRRPCDPARTAEEERILTDNSLQRGNWPKDKGWEVTAPRQERPLESMTTKQP